MPVEVPIGWIIFAVAADQGLICPAEVEPHASPNAVELVFADTAFREQQAH